MGIHQWQMIRRAFTELTAAGLFGTFTRFPFHPTPCSKASEQNQYKGTNKRAKIKVAFEFLQRARVP